MSSAFHRIVVCPIFIGHQLDLTALQVLIDRKSRGDGQAILVSGEAGIGKSRLVAEAQIAAAKQGFLLLQGQCFQTDRAFPYTPLLDLFRSYFARSAPSALADHLHPFVAALSRQERPHRAVAVKLIHRHLASDPAAWQLLLARFQREADATATLDHRHIVPIFASGETDDLAYLVMPYLPDGSLSTWLTRQGPFALPQTIAYVEQVASALDYAHARGIIHRDVKPANMLVHPDGRVVLSDFGIAHLLHLSEQLPVLLPALTSAPRACSRSNRSTWSNTALTQASLTIGTPEFMPPEQVRGDLLTSATDQYALGIATYAMLVGRTPFGGGNATAVLLRHLGSLPPPLRTVRPEIPARVEEVIFWALAKDPADRPATASQFARALRAALETKRLVRGAGWTRKGSSLPIGPLEPEVVLEEANESSNDKRTTTTSPGSSSRHRVLNRTPRSWWIPLGIRPRRAAVAAAANRTE